MDQPTTFTIDRSKWRCGDRGKFQHGKGDTALLNDQGYMCCLGMVELQLGLTQSQILSIGNPNGTKELNILTTTKEKLGICNNELSITAMKINDDTTIEHDVREKKLVELFSEHGYTLVFTGEFHDN